MNEQDIETRNIKEMCLRYFRGESTFEDERFIHERLLDGSLSMDDFRSMESDWLASESVSFGKRTSYSRLQSEIGSRRRRRFVFKRLIPAVGAAAAAVALIVSIFSGKDHVTTTCSTAYLETKVVVLPDSSRVSLNSATTLTYNSDFNKKDRTVTLSGEAFFDVSKDPSKPFVVKMKDAEITVKGTSFNVSAYDGENGIQAALLTGQIQFQTGKDYIYLSPGEVITYNRLDRSMSKSRRDVGQYCSWMEGRIDCESITLDWLFTRLTSLYGVKIDYTPVKYKDRTIRVILDTSESLDDVLGALSVIVPIKWTWHDDGRITIMEK